jgi:hypothetical protein
VIAVLVQSANRDLLLRSLQLPLDIPVIGAAVRFDGKTSVGPQLSLAAEAVRRLQNRDQLRRLRVSEAQVFVLLFRVLLKPPEVVLADGFKDSDEKTAGS